MKKQIIAIALAAVMAAGATTAPTPQTKMFLWITRASTWKPAILT